MSPTAKVYAFVEVTSGVVRAGPAARAYGDPYEHAISFSSVDGKTAVLKGWSGKPPLAHLRAAKAALTAIGLRLTWERIRNAAAKKRKLTQRK